MRKLLLALGVTVLVCALLLLAAVVSLNRIVAANRARIVQRMQTAIGLPVSVEQITVSVWGGLGVQLQGVQVTNAEQFGGTFMTANAITARADLTPLLGGVLNVSRIDVAAPLFNIIRNARGEWNYAGMLRRGTQVGSSDGRQARQGEALVALVAQANVRDGTVELVDHRSGGWPTLRATQVDLSLTDVNETTPIHFAVDAALDSPMRNVHLTGTLGPLVDLDAIPLALAGTVGPLGPQRLEVDDLQITAVLVPDAVRVTKAEGSSFGGTFEGSGELPWGDGPAWAKGDVSGVDVARIIEIVLPRANLHISGTGAATADLRSAGSTAQSLQHDLVGTVDATVTNGAIADFNIVKEVLGTITGLPGISSLITATVKPKYGRLFAESQTRLDKLHGTFRIADERVRTDDLTILATDYEVRAAGWVGFNASVNMVGTLAMSERFSSAVASDVKEVRRILDANGKLVIPFKLRGQLGQATPQPEIAGLLGSLTSGAEGFVEKLFGGGRHDGQQNKGSSGNVIERGLRDLLGR